MEVFKLFATMSLKDVISKPLMKIQKVMKDAGTNAKSLSGRMMGLGKAMLPVIAGAAAVVTHFGYATKKAADFESAVARLAIVHREGADALKELEKAALKMGASSVYSANEVVAAQAVLAQSGFTTTENIRMLAQTEKYAAAAGMDLTAATSDLADIIGVYGLKASDTQRLTDTMTAATRSAGISFAELTTSLKGAGNTFKNLNIPIEESIAMMGALADVGIKGGEAASFLELAIGKLMVPSASVSESLRQLGVTTTDLSGKLKSPTTVLNELSKSLSHLNDGAKLEKLKELVGEKNAYTMFDLIKSEGLESIERLNGSLKDCTGITAQMAAVQNGTLASSMKRLGNSINTINITIGKLFAPTINAIATKLAGLAAILADVAASPIGQLILKLTAGMAIGVLAVGGLAAAIAGVTAVMPAFMGGLLALKAATASLAWPFTLVAIAIGVFAYIWKKNLGGIADFVKDKFNKINLVIKGVTAVFRSLKDGVGEIKGQLAEDIQANGLVKAVTLIGKVFYRVYQFTSGFFEAIGEAIGEVVNSLAPVGEVVKAVFAPVGKLFGLLGKVIGLLAGASAATNSGGWKTFGKIIGTVVCVPFRVLAFVLGKIAAVMAVVVKIITAPFMLLIGFISRVVDAFVFVHGLIKKVFSGAGEQATVFGKVIAAVGKVILLPFKLWGAVIKGFISILKGITGIAGKVFGGIGKAASGLKDKVGGAFSTIGGLAKKGFNGALKVHETVFNTMGGLAKKGISGVGSIVSGALKGGWGIAEKIAGIFNIDLTESGKKLLETFTSGIKSMITAPFDTIKEGLSKVRNLLPFSDAKAGPLSTLTLSGSRMMSTLGAGVLKGAPELFRQVNNVFDDIPAPELKAPELSMEPAPASHSGKSTTTGKDTSGGTVIHIANITLPAVTNAEDFVSALEQLALQGGKL